MVESFLDAEAEAQKKLEPQLQRHIDLAISALNLMADVANAAPPPVPSEKLRILAQSDHPFW